MNIDGIPVLFVAIKPKKPIFVVDGWRGFDRYDRGSEPLIWLAISSVTTCVVRMEA